MKKVNCNVIRDILPLYADNVVSDDTRAIVEEHLGCCEECCNEIFAMKKELMLPVKRDLQLEEAKVLLRLRRRLQIKKALIVAVAVLAVLGILSGLYYWANTKKLYVPYEELQLEVVKSDKYLLAEYKGTYSEVVATEIFEREAEDGGYILECQVMVICAYETPWSRYIEPLFKWSKEEEENHIFLGAQYEVDQIYYGDFDTRIIQRGAADSFDNLKLIWSEPNY